MQSTGRRAALLAGASFSALCSATPLLAATTTRPGIQHTDTSDPVSDTLVICDIGSPPASPCFYGIVAEGTAQVSATLNAVADGNIAQTGTAASGDVVLTLANDGISVITAFAAAQSGTSTVGANARINDGVRQLGQGPADVDLDFNNDGALAIHAEASASAPAAPGHATAVVSGGIDQHAISSGSGLAHITLTNDGQIDVAATAAAVGGGTATAATTSGSALAQASAEAGVRRGIWQIANAASGDASIQLDNEGTIVVAARADATAITGTAFALASVTSGIAQGAHALSGGDAVARLTNDGTIDIGLNASANASGVAIAAATIIAGGYQSADAIGGGSATAIVTNNGMISEHATAVANGASAFALALESQAFVQSVLAVGGSTPGGSGHALAELTNSGSIAIHGIANATAGTGSAAAEAIGHQLLAQKVGAVNGIAAASLDNDGSIDLVESAKAQGLGPAFAGVLVSSAFVQDVSATSGDASGNFDNSGSLSIAGIAQATGVGVLTGTEISNTAIGVVASANVNIGFNQNIITRGGGDAAAQLANSGSIAVGALATAAGDGSVGGVAALAVLSLGVLQVAQGFTSVTGTAGATGDALAILDNSGSVTLLARANAEATAGGAALAGASADFVFIQAANAANGDALATLTNSGNLTIAVTAEAVADAGSSAESADAAALAGETFIFGQNANASAGSAFGSLLNSGEVNLAVRAHAEADAGAATAIDAVFGGLRQLNTGSTGAGGQLTNSGTFAIGVEAAATGASALAQAAVILGIQQDVESTRGAASAQFDNSGTIEIGSSAKAEATKGSATARAATISGIEQIVIAGVGRDASPVFDNSGDILMAAIASATAGTHASALAVDFNALVQAAVNHGGGKASAAFANEGTIAQVAVAEAHGASASAFAEIGTAILQAAQAQQSFTTVFTSSGTIFGTAPGGDAVASLANSGTIMIAGLAHAEASAGIALASATGQHVIDQHAVASDGRASADFVNRGSMSIIESAAATGSSAFALASVASGVFQPVTAPNGDAAAAFDNQGTITIASIAEAQAADGDALATALINGGIVLAALGGNSAAVDFTNSGTILLAASAQASGHGGEGDDVAAHALVIGIDAFASVADGTATINLDNQGTITLEAQAGALGFELAQAQATAFVGLGATATALSGDAVISLGNGGDLRVLAAAAATGQTNATAVAQGIGGMVAVANGLGAGDASAQIANSGSLVVDAHASAKAAGTGIAVAVAATGIFDDAHAAAGSASVAADNSGSIDILAGATATAEVAQATALAGGGIFGGAVFQSVIAGDGNASGVFTNGGEINIQAIAKAEGTTFAQANAFGGPGVQQFIFATGGDAAAAVSNNGAMNFAVAADAAADTSAFASAFFFNAMVGAAFVATGGDASANVANHGTLDIDVLAHASADGIAGAHATASHLAVAGGFNFTDGDVHSVLQNDGAITVDVAAVATGATALAFATVATAAMLQTANVLGAGSAEADLANDGSIAIAAAAKASGPHATAIALIEGAVGQSANAADGAAAVALLNSGTIDLQALASADAHGGNTAFAVATVEGFVQQAHALSRSVTFSSSESTFGITTRLAPNGPASAAFDNQGSITIGAHAAASGAASATGLAFATAVSQTGDGTDIHLSVDNAGTINLVAAASATATDIAIARANAGGVRQVASALGVTVTVISTISGPILSDSSTFVAGNGFARLDNSGTLSVTATAHANADAVAEVNALATGIEQIASGTSASVAIDNDGTINVEALAQATGTQVAGQVTAVGATQIAVGEDSAAASLTNSGTFRVIAHETLSGDKRASGLANALGIQQDPQVAGGSAAVVNAGTVAVGAQVEASGASHADGQATAVGIRQNPFRGDYSATLDNSGTILVAAAVKADVEDGGSAFGAAFGTGFEATGSNIVADIDNSGILSVLADVEAVAATGEAQARAVGLHIFASANTGLGEAGVIEGTIDNSGMLEVAAKVEGGGADTALSEASAVGISLTAGANSASVTNSGTILVQAISATGGEVSAIGILGKADGIIGDGSTVLTINNSGDLIARVSTDGGDTWRRGTAIDVSNAPNPTVVNLLGGGAIYGNVALADGDVINVNNGTTYFDGIINPGSGTFESAAAGAAPIGTPGVGTLNIGNGGNLILADPRLTGDPATYDGPAYAFVDTLNVAADGTLTFELQPEAGGAQAAGTYPQVFADTANLAGALAVQITPAGGLFADSYVWDNLIDANSRNGEFDACGIGGRYAGSLLLHVSCSYDGDANVDVALTRVAFNASPGLNGNGEQVGEGLECLYDTALAGPFADVLADLFLLSDAAGYNNALNQLAGASYANYLQSFPSLGVHYNDLLDQATNCEGLAVAGSVLECRGSSPIHVWGQLDYQWRKADGDSEAGSLKSKRFAGLLGLDSRVGNSVIVGVSAGTVNNHTRDNQFGDRVDADGMQVGAYAVYDPGPFYVKGVTTYSWYDGDSKRELSFAGLAPGASFAATVGGDPDVNMWTVGLHGGARLPMDSSSVLTPYLSLDYVNAKMHEFVETGASGAELHLGSNRANHAFLGGGVKWSTQIGRLLPAVNLGYRYRFGEQRTHITEALQCQIDTCGFDVVSANASRGTFVAALSVGGKLGRADVRIGYEGELNGDVYSHAANFRLVLPFGGDAAPRR